MRLDSSSGRRLSLQFTRPQTDVRSARCRASSPAFWHQTIFSDAVRPMTPTHFSSNRRMHKLAHCLTGLHRSRSKTISHDGLAWCCCDTCISSSFPEDDGNQARLCENQALPPRVPLGNALETSRGSLH